MTPLIAALLLAQKGGKLPPVDRWSPPMPRIFASDSGLFALKVVPLENGTKAVGSLFSIDASGSEVVIWKRALECVPVEAYVSDGGHVATVDEWGGKGKKHSLVLYNSQGKTLADLDLRGIYPELNPDRDRFVLRTPSSYNWTVRAQITFYRSGDIRHSPESPFEEGVQTASGYIFSIRTLWGEQVRFDPDTGKMIDRKKYRT